MPAISNIRIINLSYGQRRIIDDTFRMCHNQKCENTIMNLENGGGKSVLVQFILQPIVPKASINKRKVENYFNNTGEPAFILLEMKLDNSKNEFITLGIAMCAGENNVDKNSSVRFFTFITQYNKAVGPSPFGIERLEFSEKEGKHRTFLTYKSAMDYIKQLANKNRQVKYFHQDDVKEYYKELETYGISHNEWEKIMLPINNYEGGVTDFFNSYNTTNKLLNGLLIETIDNSKKIEAVEGEDSELTTMMQYYVNKLVENEQNIKIRDMTQEFVVRLEECKDPVEKLWKYADAYENAIGELYAMDKEINALIGKKDLIIQANLIEKDSIVNKRLEIDIEKWSMEYHHFQEQFLQVSKGIETLELTRKEIDRQIIEHEKEIKQQDAIRIWESMVVKNNKLEVVRKDIQRVEEHSDNREEIARLRYSILIKAQKASREMEAYLEEKEAEVEVEEQNQKNYVLEKKQVEQTERDLTSENGKLQAQIHAFQERTRQLEKQCHIVLEENLEGNYDSEDIKVAEEKLREEQEQLYFALERLKEIAQQQMEKSETLLEERTAKEIENASLQRSLVEIQEKLQEYYRRKEVVETALYHQEIEKEGLFDKTILQPLEEKHVRLQEALQNKKKQKQNNLEELQAAETGSLHLSKKLIEQLELLEIPYKTGETWFAEYEDLRDRQKVLDAFPALPYAIIVYDKYVDAVMQLKEEIWLPSLGCVVTYTQINSILIGKNTSLVDQNNMELLCCYEHKILTHRDEFISDLKYKIQDNTMDIKNYEQSLETLERDMGIIGAFDYAQTFEVETRQEMNRKENRQKENAIRLQGLMQEMTQLKNDKNVLEEKKEENLNRKVKITNDIDAFMKWKEDMHGHYKNISNFSHNAEILEDAFLQKQRLENAIETAREYMAQLKEEIRSKEQEQSLCEKYKMEFQGAEETEIDSRDLAMLYSMYSELISSMSRDLEGNKNREKEILKELEILKKDLENLGELEEDYKTRDYDPQIRAQLSHELPELRKKKDQKSNEMVQRTAERSKYETEKNNKRRQIEEKCKTIVERIHIKADFEARKQALLEKQAQLEEEISIIQTEIKELGQVKAQTEFLKGQYRYEGQGKTLSLEENKKEQVAKIKQKIQVAEQEKKELLTWYKNKIEMMYHQYEDQNKIFRSILEDLRIQLQDIEEKTFARYYSIYENIEIVIGKIKEYMYMINRQLKDLDQYKEHFMTQCHIQGRTIYTELEKLTKASLVKLPGMSRKIKMLQIKLPTEIEEEQARLRIETYLTIETETLAREIKDGMDLKETIKRIGQVVHSRELLNKYIGKEHITIEAYRIDANRNNSEYRNWENALTDNSGGEKFVVFFAVLLALMYYTRNLTGAETENITGTLVMDNPFGAISSEHLLKPMFTIAERFGIQLICLTQLDTVEILNCFKVVYKIKTKKMAYSNYAVVEFDAKNKNEEILENGYYKGTQMNLI